MREGTMERIHHSPPHITNRYNPLLLSIPRLRKQRKRLLDLVLFRAGYVVLFCELGLSRFGR